MQDGRRGDEEEADAEDQHQRVAKSRVHVERENRDRDRGERYDGGDARPVRSPREPLARWGLQEMRAHRFVDLRPERRVTDPGDGSRLRRRESPLDALQLVLRCLQLLAQLADFFVPRCVGRRRILRDERTVEGQQLLGEPA